MTKVQISKLLKQYIDDIAGLRTLDYRNQDFKRWAAKVKVLASEFDYHDQQKIESLSPVLTGRYQARTYERRYLKALDDYESALEAIALKREIAKPSIALFDGLKFHPKVVEVSRQLFEDGHYRDAIYRAFVEVNNLVKDKAHSQLDGKSLMSTTFSLDKPIIKLNMLQTQSDRDEQEGFMYLFMGAMQGIRNPKAHENLVQKDPHRTLEYLGLASLLIKRLEEGTA